MVFRLSLSRSNFYKRFICIDESLDVRIIHLVTQHPHKAIIKLRFAHIVIGIYYVYTSLKLVFISFITSIVIIEVFKSYRFDNCSHNYKSYNFLMFLNILSSDVCLTCPSIIARTTSTSFL